MCHFALWSWGPSRAQTAEPQRPRQCLSHSSPEKEVLPEAQTYLPGTVEDVVLFVFPGIEQHDHTPGEMSERRDLAPDHSSPRSIQATWKFRSLSTESCLERVQRDPLLATEGN